MKQARILIVAVALFSAFLISCDDKPLPADQLPPAARTYIEQNYPGSTILIVKKDLEAFSSNYDVKLDNGLDLSFDSDGLLIDIDD